MIQAFAGGRPRLAGRPATVRPTSSSSTRPIPGSGSVFDWTLAEGAPAASACCSPAGSTPTTWRGDPQVRPWGVDVSSGVEASPGQQGRQPSCAASSSRGQGRGDEVARRRDGAADGERSLRLGGRRYVTDDAADSGDRERPRTGRARRSGRRRPRPPGPEPADLGRFGEFGGRFVPETLIPALEELEAEFRTAWASTTSGPSSPSCCAATPAGRRRSPSATACRSSSACGCCSSART